MKHFINKYQEALVCLGNILERNQSLAQLKPPEFVHSRRTLLSFFIHHMANFIYGFNQSVIFNKF